MLLSSLLLALTACTAADSRPPGLSAIDPEHRRTAGALATDLSGRHVVALPAGRPLREVSVYDLALGTVTRLNDPTPDTWYREAPLSISRDGNTVFAVRRYLQSDRYPELVSIDVATGRARVLSSKARQFRDLAPSPDGRYLYYLRDVDDRGPMRPAATEPGSPQAVVDLSGASGYAWIARYDLEAGLEERFAKVALVNPLRLQVDREGVYFAAETVLSDDAQGAGPFTSHTLRKRAAQAQLARRHQPQFYRLPADGVLPKSMADIQLLAPRDLGLSNPNYPKPVTEAFGYWPHQLSDDGATYYMINSEYSCWGNRVVGDVACSPHSFDAPQTVWVDAVMARDGRVAVVGWARRLGEADVIQTQWCLLQRLEPVSSCQWRDDNASKITNLNIYE